jgi:hypothetical protein
LASSPAQRGSGAPSTMVSLCTTLLMALRATLEGAAPEPGRWDR